MDYWSPLHRELPPGLIQAKLKETKEKILAKFKITILGRYISSGGFLCHFWPFSPSDPSKIFKIYPFWN